MNRLFYVLLGFFISFVLGKEYLTINEEIFLISGFFVFFYFAYNNISKLLYDFLSDRSLQIFESISSSLQLKQTNLKNLKLSYSNLLYCVDSLVVVYLFLANSRATKFNFWQTSVLQTLYGVVSNDLALIFELDLLTVKYYNTFKLLRLLSN
jgi:hypothetical protein